jgi:lipopolysaccharide/colanic/teichoic acid biosynthesis glycosyltransferase
MAASKRMQRTKAVIQTNRLSIKTFFALHKQSPSRAAFASNKIQFCRRISLKEIGMLRARRIVAYFVLTESSFVRVLWRRKLFKAQMMLRPADWVNDSRRRRNAMAPTLAVPYQQDNVVPFRHARNLISIRPIECSYATIYRSRRSRRRFVEPSASIRKRLFDVIASGSALFFLAPLLIVIAITIKLTSPGPVFFFQYRYGFRNRYFKIYKFRSMRTSAGDRSGVKQTVQGDSRVTAIGKILRKTSLDEIPQLINVIKGDMSLVGPRPHVPGMLAAQLLYEDLVPYYFQRHSARPGITGLAQISGCRGSTIEAGRAISRIDYDLEYIEKWSLSMDIKIILLTVRREFLSGSGV